MKNENCYSSVSGLCSFGVSDFLVVLFYLISIVQYLDNKKEDEKENEEEDLDDDDITEKRRKFFSEKSNYSPETRVEMQKVLEEINREKENVGDVPKNEKKQRKLFME